MNKNKPCTCGGPGTPACAIPEHNDVRDKPWLWSYATVSPKPTDQVSS